MDYAGSPVMDFSCMPIGQPLIKVFRDFERYHPVFSSPKSPRMQICSTSGKGSSSSPEQGSEAGSECSMTYLGELLNEKKQLSLFPHVFDHSDRLVNEEINRVRRALFQYDFSVPKFDLPEPVGVPITVQEKVYVPCKEHPDYNFVGRILGPRGLTAKQLEEETGCKIMIRGRGSLRDVAKEELNRGKQGWEHLNDELHVLVQCEDTPNRAYIKLKSGVDEIRKMLVPVEESADELKRRQLMELAIINGTYRPFAKLSIHAPRLLTPVAVVSPVNHMNGQLPPQQMFVSPMASPITTAMDVAAPMYNSYMQSPVIKNGQITGQVSCDLAVGSRPTVSEGQAMSAASPMASSIPLPGLSHYFIDPTAMTPPESTRSFHP